MTGRLYHGGRIFTAVPDDPFAEALVVRGGEIVVAGSLAEARAQAGGDVEEVDLAGRMVMPGIHDAHLHLLVAALKVKWGYEIRLTAHAGAEQIIAELKAAEQAGRHAPGGWLIAGDVFPTPAGEARLDLRMLDEAFPDTPVFVNEYSQHHAFANSVALARAGITADATDSNGAVYARDAEGRLTGELVERATWRVQHLLPKPDLEHVKRTLRWAVGMCHRYGITSVQEASASREELRALSELDRDGGLDLHVAAHVVWREEGLGGAPGDELERLLQDAPTYRSPHVNTDFVKIFVDGAPLAPNLTHSTLTPDETIDEHWVFFDPDELAGAIDRFDGLGRLVKLHCSGMGAARAAIDAIERVRATRDSGLSHEIAHAGYVHDKDRDRMAALGITAEMSPALWHIPEYHLEDGFDFGDMTRRGVRLTVGSDWIITPDPNLFPGIQGMVEHARSSVDLQTALFSVTRTGALQVGKASSRGTLEPGKLADYIVLDRDLFAVPSREIGDAQVLETHFGGRLVYSAAAEPPRSD